MASILVVAIAGAAAGAPRCPGHDVTEIRTIEKLPDALRHLLTAAKSRAQGVADRDARFNATDVVDPHLPMRRFVLAALGTSCAVVAVEYGGRAHGFELTEYHLTDAGWAAVDHHTVAYRPATIGDLLTN